MDFVFVIKKLEGGTSVNQPIRKTFTNAMGKECPEIDYFLHNLSTYSNKEVIDTIVENTSDHHPIRIVFKFEHKAYKNESKHVQKIERRIKWEKVWPCTLLTTRRWK